MRLMGHNQAGETATRQENYPHTFHIPVMGTGFTIDTPLRIARFGIASVISIGDDILIEQMRQLHCEKNGLTFTPIKRSEEDYRAKRITTYLNLVHTLVQKQTAELAAGPFEPGSEITRYFELLPQSPLRQAYREMLDTSDPQQRAALQQELRKRVTAGSIDVNIMTKLDRDVFRDGVKLPKEHAIAMSAFRGFANSTLESSVVLSAGLNRRLYGYIPEFDDFLPDAEGKLKKKIVLKVSDFRSAASQGKMLAKKGVWVSEYRIESGLNCGGHAFATNGHLMGPILEEFKQQRATLTGELHAFYKEALAAKGKKTNDEPFDVRVTVQGGICTADEDSFLRRYYEVDGTGWGTPFLLVPEVTNVDDAHLEKLCKAGSADVHLSHHSPLGVPFWSLRTSASEETRMERIRNGKPGSPCPKGYLGFNTEFTELPVCQASGIYQKHKVEEIANNGFSPEQVVILRELVLSKSCICCDLAGGATLKNGMDATAKTAICCGPNIAYFSEVTTLDKMVDHIYGRISLLNGKEYPHMFISELSLYVDHLRGELANTAFGVVERTAKYFLEFRQNLVSGIDYYRQLATNLQREKQEKFLRELEALRIDLERILPEIAITPAM